MGRDDGVIGFRRRRPVAQREIRPAHAVLHPPLFDHDLRLLQRIEDLSVQALVPQLAVEALAVAVLSRTARCDVQRLGADRRQPRPQLLGAEFGAIV